MSLARAYGAALALALAPNLAGARSSSRQWERIAGLWSSIDRPLTVVVQDPGAWRRLWAEHLGGSPREITPPAVDFTRETVVAVFLGVQRTGASVGLEVRPGREPGEVVARYRLPPGRKPFSIQALTQPFEILKIPKASDVRFEVAPESRTAPPSAAHAETGVRDALAEARGRFAGAFGARTGGAAFDGAARDREPAAYERD